MRERWKLETETLGRFAGWILGAIVVALLLYVLAWLVRLNLAAWGAILGF